MSTANGRTSSGACLGCQSRKVRCVKEDGAEKCNECNKRSIPCQPRANRPQTPCDPCVASAAAHAVVRRRTRAAGTIAARLNCRGLKTVPGPVGWDALRGTQLCGLVFGSPQCGGVGSQSLWMSVCAR
ncbi:hypothetical protein C8Q70DRAFT_24901 [Cubamyces menziesii]|nr:hypothetical protein C8Q70DRAFT_24901 [Cubamyces menziesii]